MQLLFDSQMKIVKKDYETLLHQTDLMISKYNAFILYILSPSDMNATLYLHLIHGTI